MTFNTVINQNLKGKEDLRHVFIVHYGDNHIQKASVHCEGKLALLYQQTPLAKLDTLSPVVIEIQTENALETLSTAVINKELDGILLSIPKALPFDTLLGLLRERLFIRFDGERKGVLHFQNPLIASHFFKDSTIEDTSLWLNCMIAVSWLDCSPWGSQQWECMINNITSTNNKAPSDAWTLLFSQQAALCKTVDDKILKSYFTHLGTGPSKQQWQQGYQYIALAEAYGIDTEPDIHTFLHLAFNQHEALIHALNTYSVLPIQIQTLERAVQHSQELI
ncbi:hypothetical protein [Photobacterium indicum]|uniref:hypothetical protein n=1 Tax=Photobacterium indicum TaxID=81447 RepID=UPI003D131871